jgi:hypothetical protein
LNSVNAEKEKLKSVVGRLMSALATLGVFRQEEWKGVGLGELLDYTIQAHLWIFGISEKAPGPLPRQLAEKTKEVVRQLVEQKLAEVKENEESLRQEGYGDRDIRLIYDLYETAGRWVEEAIDWLTGLGR